MSLAERADELDKKLEQNPIDQSIATLVKADNRRRRQVMLLAVSLALDFVLTIGLTFLSFQTSHIAQLAQNNKEAVILNCETANDSRDAQRKLWAYVIALPPQQPRSPEQQQRVEEFQVFVDKTFKPRDCQAEANK